MSAQNFANQLASYAELTDAELIRIIRSGEQVPNLHDGMIYSMGLDVEDRRIRGKRIRPALCLLTAESLGVPAQRALHFAAAIELLHNFALVHDDIEDGDTQRRGRPTTHIRFGLAHGINIGDFLLAKVFGTIWRDPHQTMAIREELVELLNLTLEDLFAGQALDISARNGNSFTMEEYETLVMKKTGSYLSAPMIGGAIIADADEEVILILQKLGRLLGPLFQIRDDIIDLTSGKGREAIGNDIREGKRSYLVAALCRHCSDAERAQIFTILNKPRESTTQDDVSAAIALFTHYDLINKASAHCEKLRREAVLLIADLPVRLRENLEQAIEILVNRET
ncbi:MAG TPA: polyprenyl synthetase family protein [Candidatus Sumerlaeota bacterium]|nr:polyprenyl synthetase family protein [Candidatus Sumerlaeota bacterium]